MNNKTIFVVDDDREICSALRWLLESIKFQVETYDCGRKFLANYNPEREGCLILDVRMPIMSGLELLDRLNEKKSILPVIIITGHGDIPMAVRALKAGAVDFILKPINEQYLLEVINFSLEKKYTKKNNIPSMEDHILTNREKEILNLIINGKLNKEIAYKLNIAISTVEAHRSRIMQKYKARNLAQLFRNYFKIPEQI